jgi:hypothetical protein
MMEMSETDATLPAQAESTEITPFNALKHGILSRYTVLPWEDASEYHALVAALVAICLSSCGATCDEIEVSLGLLHQTASAEIRKLVLLGKLSDRLLRTLRAILIDTTRKAFRGDTPEERAARLEKPWEEETVA